jgi:hypothetical protein
VNTSKEYKHVVCINLYSYTFALNLKLSSNKMHKGEEKRKNCKFLLSYCVGDREKFMLNVPSEFEIIVCSRMQ